MQRVNYSDYNHQPKDEGIQTQQLQLITLYKHGVENRGYAVPKSHVKDAQSIPLNRQRNHITQRPHDIAAAAASDHTFTSASALHQEQLDGEKKTHQDLR